MTKEQISRISELSRLARVRALTAAEQAERAALRSAYLAAMKAALKDQLDRAETIDEHGVHRPLRRKDEGGRS